MGCACRKSSGRRAYVPADTTLTASAGTFALVMPDGTSTSYGSRLEADAARVRAGYRGSVRAV